MLAQSFAPSLESLPPTSARVSIAPRSLIASLVYMAAGTDKGRARADNQDSFIVDSGLGLAVVCDGMGGHAAGDSASRLAARTFAAAVLAGKDQLRDYVDCDGGSRQVSKCEIVELLQLAANSASHVSTVW